MATLPVTVTAVRPVKGGLYEVEVALFDGTIVHYLVPPTLATAEAVTLSAGVMAQLYDSDVGSFEHPHRKHRRYLPRP